MFGMPKKKTVDLDGKQIELQPKPNAVSKLFGSKPSAPQATIPASPQPAPAPKFALFQPGPVTTAPKPAQPIVQPPKPAAPAAPPVQQPKAPQPNKPYQFQFPGARPSSAAAQTQKPPPLKLFSQMPIPKYVPRTSSSIPRQPAGSPQGPPGMLRLYIQRIGSKHPDLEGGLRKEGIKESVYDFIKRMLILSVIFTVAIGGVSFVVLFKLLHNPLTAAILAALVAGAVFTSVFRTFLNFPTAKGKSSSKSVERDILFAARDLIIALRSGMPLFNAITSVSSGYGEASKEFLKIVERVQLGTPLEDAIDDIVSTTKSQSFRKIMLQASVSIRVGADVTSALQSVIDQLTQERVIELRRYGQRLNAIAMFYMLFGIILPSMGIAVLTILTTFIPIFAVNVTILEVVVVGLIFLQVVFLQMIRSSRPVFTM